MLSYIQVSAYIKFAFNNIFFFVSNNCFTIKNNPTKTPPFRERGFLLNFLLIFVLICAMTLTLFLARNRKQVLTIMVVGSAALVAASAYLTVAYLSQRNAGTTAPILFIFVDVVQTAKHRLFARRGRRLGSNALFCRLSS